MKILFLKKNVIEWGPNSFSHYNVIIRVLKNFSLVSRVLSIL